DEFATLRRGLAATHCLLKRGDIGNHMIGREHEQAACTAALRGKRGKRNGRRGVTSFRFEDDRGVVYVELPQLLGNEKAVFAIANDDGRSQFRKTVESLQALLEE